jgi:hypothetical protein
MQLLSPQRTVMFEGMQLVIPFNTQYLTIDDDGAIVAHGECPWPEVGFWESNNELGIVGYVSEIDGQQWKMQNDPVFVGDESPMIGDKL